MPARRYLQFLDSSFADQSDEDDLRWASTPLAMRDGNFTFVYRPVDGSDYEGGDRYLMSVEYSPGLMADIHVAHVEGITSQLLIRINGVTQGSILLEFPPGKELLFEIKQTAAQSIIKCVGNEHDSELESTSFAPGWTLSDGELRWGGNVLSDGYSARGQLSLPYAVYAGFDFGFPFTIPDPLPGETPSGVIELPIIADFPTLHEPLLANDVQNLGVGHIASTASVLSPTVSAGAAQGAFPVDTLAAGLGTLDFATDGMAVNLGVNPGDVGAYADDIDAAGFKWVRARIVWSAVEQSVGSFNWTVAPNYNNIVSQFNARGIGVMFMLRLQGNGIYGSGASPPYNASGRAAFANFCAAAASHWAGDKVLFELGNEPNIKAFWPYPDSPTIQDIVDGADDYSALANVVIPAMRSANPNVLVVGPGLAGKGGPYQGGLVGANEYMERLKDNGTIGLLDRPSIHFYTAESDNPTDNMPAGKAPEDADIDLYRGILANPTGSIFGTEHGWRSNDSSGQNRLQASYNIRDFVFGLSRGVRMRFWFLWGNSSGQTQWYIKDRDAETAAGILEQELGGYRYIRRIDTGNNDQYVYEFENASGDLRLVAWKRDSGTASAYSHPASDDATVVDVVGGTSNATESGGSISLTLSVHPVYVRLP